MWTFRWLGTIASVFSVVMLARHGFDMGSFVAPLQLMLDWYQAFLHFLFGWAEPYLHAALVWALVWTDWDLQLHPHWRDVFVLMGIYLVKDRTQMHTTRSLEARVLFSSFSGAFWVAKSAVRLVPCLLIALASSVVAGAIPLSSADPTANFAVAAAVIVGVAVTHFVYSLGIPFKYHYKADQYHEKDEYVDRIYLPLMGATTSLHEGWMRFTARNAFRALTTVALGLATVAMAMQVPWIQQQQSPVLAILALIVIARALYWFGQAHWYRLHDRDTDWIDSDGRKGTGRPDPYDRKLFYRIFPPNIPGSLSFDTLSIFMGVGLFVATNAGLKLFGL